MEPINNRSFHTTQAIQKTCAVPADEQQKVIQQLYQIAANSPHSKSASSALLDHLSANIAVFIDQPHGDPTRIPARLAEAFSLIIMTEKNGEKNNGITQFDIFIKLKQFKEMVAPVHQHAIKIYEENGLEHLLDAGIALYCDTTGKQVKLNTALFDMPAEKIWDLFSIQSFSDRVSLGSINVSYREAVEAFHERMIKTDDVRVLALREKKISFTGIFFCCPQLRKDKYIPIDEKGLKYANSLLIGGSITFEKIRKGEWTFAQAAEHKEEVVKNLLLKIEELLHQSGRSEEEVNLAVAVARGWFNGERNVDENFRLQNDAIDGLVSAQELLEQNGQFLSDLDPVRHINEGVLTIEQLLQLLRPNELPVVEDINDDEPTIDEAIDLSDEVVNQHILNSVLTIDQIIGLHSGEWHQ